MKPNSCRMELVVARYDEDLSWLGRVPGAFNVFVYNKGGSLSLDPDLRTAAVDLPNVGHEAHSYLAHIVRRYDELDGPVVFAQGKPFDHVPDFHRTLRDLVSGDLVVTGFRWLGFIIDRDDRAGSLFRRWHPGHELPIAAFWERMWGGDVPGSFIFYPGAHFVVHAECIRKQPRAYYEKAFEVSAGGMEIAHCFERCWDVFFGEDGIPSKYREAEYPVHLRPVKRLGITWDDVPPEERPWSREY